MINFQMQQRYIVATMLFLVIGVIYSIRVCFPLILTQMVYIPNVDTESMTSDTKSELICPIDLNDFSQSQNGNTSILISDFGDRYDWSQQLQGIITSSFYFGNIVSQIPGGILTQKYGGKKILVTSIFISGVFIGLTPLAVMIGGAGGFIFTRIVIGFVQGPLISCLATFFVRWFPIEERGMTTAICFMGGNTGGFVSSFIVGIVLREIGRWDVVFYGLAVITIVLSILIVFCCYNNPEEHPFISDKELEYLKITTAGYEIAEAKDLGPTPWKEMLTSVPVIALLLSALFHNYATYLLNLGLPKYLNDVLHLPIDTNSMITSLTRIIGIFVSVFTGILSDWMHVKRNISLTNIRKIFILLASVIPAIFAVAASYGECDTTLVVTLLTIAISCQGFDVAALILNPLDLSPNYVGPLNSIVQSMFSTAALLAPFTVGVLVPNAFLTEWRVVFWIAFVQYIGISVVFTIWGSGRVEPWNAPRKSVETA